MIPIWSTIGPRICHVPLTDIEQPFPKSSTSSDIQGTYSSKFFTAFYHFHTYVILQLMIKELGEGRIANYKESTIPDTEPGWLLQHTQYANPDI